MKKYLMEVSHSADRIECLRAVEVFLNSGSHFLSHADWGCFDGEHKAWLVVEAESKEELMQVVPPSYRDSTKIVELNKFNIHEIEDQIKHHQA
jgi:hypothetical protein